MIFYSELQEKYLENYKELYLVFEDLEKAFDRVLRVLIESSLRRKGEERSKSGRCRLKEFAVIVGIHQGFSPFAVYLCCGDGCGDKGYGKEGTCPDVCR